MHSGSVVSVLFVVIIGFAVFVGGPLFFTLAVKPSPNTITPTPSTQSPSPSSIIIADPCAGHCRFSGLPCNGTVGCDSSWPSAGTCNYYGWPNGAAQPDYHCTLVSTMQCNSADANSCNNMCIFTNGTSLPRWCESPVVVYHGGDK